MRGNAAAKVVASLALATLVAVPLASCGGGVEQAGNVTTPTYSSPTPEDTGAWPVDEPTDEPTYEPSDEPTEEPTYEPTGMGGGSADDWAAQANEACIAARDDTGGIPLNPGSRNYEDVMALAEARAAHITTSAAERLSNIPAPADIESAAQDLVSGLSDYADLSQQLSDAYAEGYYGKPLELQDQRESVGADVQGVAGELGVERCGELTEM